jgi:hypothetical protein
LAQTETGAAKLKIASAEPRGIGPEKRKITGALDQSKRMATAGTKQKQNWWQQLLGTETEDLSGEPK